MSPTEEQLPSQVEAENEARKLIEEAQSFQNNPPQYEVEARQRKLNELWAKAHPPETPAPLSSGPISPAPIHADGDFPAAMPSPVSPLDIIAAMPPDVYQAYIRKLLGSGSLDPAHERMRQAFHARNDRDRRGVR